MVRNKFFVTIIALGLVAAEAKNLIVQENNLIWNGLKTSSQKLKCYDSDDDNEESLQATDYIQEIDLKSKISFCIVSGIWILYDEDYYNGSSSLWMYGYNNLVKLPTEFENKVSSLRFPGAPDDWKANSLNLYTNENFMGKEEFTYEDIPKFTIEAKSVIVTGCKPWTVYTESNYQGESKCIYPSDIKKCTPGLYPTVSSLEGLSGKIFSARRGCQGEEEIRNDLGAVSNPSATGAFGILSPPSPGK